MLSLCCCCCAAILAYCSVRDWRHYIGFEKIRIHPSTSYPDSLMRVEAVSGKKKLRVQKYPDMCGRFRGLIALIYQSDCSNSIAGPIFSQCWTGHCPE